MMTLLDVSISELKTWAAVLCAERCQTHICNITATVKVYKMLPAEKDLKYETDSESSQTSNRLFPFVVVICSSSLFVFLPIPPFFISFARQRMALSRISSSVTLPNMKTLMSGVFLSQRVNLNPTQIEQSSHSTLSTTLTKTLINQQVPLTIQHTLSPTQILA